MYILGLAADFNGTIAQHGCRADGHLHGIERTQGDRTALILVTGRELAAHHHD